MQFITDIDQIDHILNIQGLIGLQQYDIFDGLAVRGRVVFKNRRKPGFDLSESDLLVIDIILPVAGNDQHDVFLDSYLFRRARMRQQHLQCHRRDHRGDDQEKQQQEKQKKGFYFLVKCYILFNSTGIPVQNWKVLYQGNPGGIPC